jgi:hydroxymethylglutaryl-CoA lyase
LAGPQVGPRLLRLRQVDAPGVRRRGPRAPDVGIYEVSPRDGLQNEAEFVSTEAKLELIALLATSGLRRIEVASFVSPSWIPQLADADELVAVLRRSPGVRYGALVPNEKGYEWGRC